LLLPKQNQYILEMLQHIFQFIGNLIIFFSQKEKEKVT
jgi:hypothetical protein